MAIQFEALRNGPERLDERFRVLARDLEIAYYHSWQHGRSFPVWGFDRQSTPEQSKRLFDQLHGLLWHHYNLYFHILNHERADFIPDSRYRYEFADDGVTVLRDKVAESMLFIAQPEFHEMIASLRVQLDRAFHRTIPWP